MHYNDYQEIHYYAGTEERMCGYIEREDSLRSYCFCYTDYCNSARQLNNIHLVGYLFLCASSVIMMHWGRLDTEQGMCGYIEREDSLRSYCFCYTDYCNSAVKPSFMNLTTGYLLFYVTMMISMAKWYKTVTNRSTDCGNNRLWNCFRIILHLKMGF